jgi:hypothetical protein
MCGAVSVTVLCPMVVGAEMSSVGTLTSQGSKSSITLRWPRDARVQFRAAVHGAWLHHVRDGRLGLVGRLRRHMFLIRSGVHKASPSPSVIQM